MVEKVLTTIGIATVIALLGHLAGWQPWRSDDDRPEHGDWGAILGITGATAFTRTSGASSRASSRISWCAPAFDTS